MSIIEKLNSAPDSKFVESLRDQYSERGFLTEKQEIALDAVLRYSTDVKMSPKSSKYEDSDPEELSDLLI